jgi:hypothetical protein
MQFGETKWGVKDEGRRNRGMTVDLNIYTVTYAD